MDEVIELTKNWIKKAGNEAEEAVNIAGKVKGFVLARLEDSGFTR